MKNRILSLLALAITVLPAQAFDLRTAVVVSPAKLSAPERKAVTMLVEEVEKRTGIRWEQSSVWPGSNESVISVGPISAMGEVAGPFLAELQSEPAEKRAEGFRVSVKQGQRGKAVFVLGADERGVLFGVGKLLQELRLDRGSVTLADSLEIASAPKYALRGHQLGYRPKCNSYDAWDLPVWEQYIRDLAVFGCNAIELIPPRSDDDADSPHFPRPPMEMMTGMSRICADYGLDVWIWYPAMDADYANPKTVGFALAEWGEVFRKLPRVDAVLVPAGDPGHTRPKYLMALLEKQTANLRQYHPKAQMWVSAQSFDQVWLDEFIQILQHDQPTWLAGVVFGPQVRISLPKLRELVPCRYPIRHYPDITHSRQCEYPVPDWDTAFALTEARECINPRPEGEADIFRASQAYTIGFLSYSEGCNDDVNKFVWSGLGWNPEESLTNILRGYGRYFISAKQGEAFADGLFALEKNWQGPLATNGGIVKTLHHFQAMEKAATPFELRNWRFQQGLFRAYYDAYTQKRLNHEKGLEASAMERLQAAPAIGSLDSLAAATKVLDGVESDRVAEDWRIRILELGDALFQSIGMQLSVDKYRAIAPDRGASLDTLDYPLNDRAWLKEQFFRIRKMTNETARVKAINEIVNWTNPGPGGFYDDLGNIAQQPHLVVGKGFKVDPGCFESVRVDTEEDLVVDEPEENPGVARRRSWMDHAESLYDAPLRMRYAGLDPRARYKLRVVYAGDAPKKKLRLQANEGIEIHPLLTKPWPFVPLEFPIPAAATAGGELNLSWFGEPGLGGNGRGCQVSEVWLIRVSESAEAKGPAVK